MHKLGRRGLGGEGFVLRNVNEVSKEQPICGGIRCCKRPEGCCELVRCRIVN